MKSTPRIVVITALWSMLVLVFPAAPSAANDDADEQPRNPLKQLTLEALGSIEVTTASKEPETVRRTPSAIFVLTQEDIRRSGATTIPELLRLVPGLDVARIDSDHWSVGVRGFGDQFSKSVLVLMDGRSLYTPLFAGVFWGVQDTALDDIARIEVIRGPGGTIWGANAFSGVINIITKSAKDTAGTLASIGGGSVDHAIGGFRYGGGNGKNLDYRIYGKGFSRGPQFHADRQNFDNWRMAQTGFRADWSAGRDSLTVQGDLYGGRNGQSISLGSFSPPSQALTFEPLDVSGGNLLTRWRRSLAGGSSAQLEVYYDRTHLLGPQVGETRNTLDVDFIHHVAGVRRNDLIWGVGGRWSPSHITQTVPTLDFTPRDQATDVYSVFGQDEITLVDKTLWLTIGTKVEHNSYVGFDIQPSARLLWTPTARQSVWTAFTRAVRTPSRLEQDFQLSGFLAPSPPTFIRIIGNKDFESERLIGSEAGYRNEVTDQFYIDVSVFHNELDNLESFGAFSIAIETSPPPPRLLLVLPYANGVMGSSNGIEVSPDWKPTRWWQLKGSYSYLQIDVKNKTGNADVRAVQMYEGSSPRHQVLVRSLLNLPKDWELDATYRHVSALPARTVDAYSALDLRLGWRPAQQFEVSVVGQNLTESHHQEFGHDPPPPVELKRGVFASITWRR